MPVTTPLEVHDVLGFAGRYVGVVENEPVVPFLPNPPHVVTFHTQECCTVCVRRPAFQETIGGGREVESDLKHIYFLGMAGETSLHAIYLDTSCEISKGAHFARTEALYPYKVQVIRSNNKKSKDNNTREVMNQNFSGLASSPKNRCVPPYQAKRPHTDTSVRAHDER